MRVEEVLQKQFINDIPDRTVVGIDIGSRQAKAVLLNDGNIYTTIMPTGFYMQETAENLLGELLGQAGLERKDVEFIVGTGYGRVSLDFSDIPYRLITEIACHGKGAHFLAEDIRTIIDIGGQDSKAIQINPENGDVITFAMNDKCAAGTGRFLEKISGVLGLDVTEIGEVSLKADKSIKIDSTCVVFAESEVVSQRARGEKVENIASGIHYAVAKRVTGLLNKVGIESNVLFTGGVSNNIGMKKAFEELLGIKIEESKLNTVFAGALGASVFAAEFARNQAVSEKEINVKKDDKDFSIDLTSFRKEKEREYKEFVNHTSGKSAYVAYTCTYTPLEILASADVAYTRIYTKGTQEEIISAETVTQSMYCDHAKSIIGTFSRESELAKAVEKVYTFYTCGCMRAAVEALNFLYVPAIIYNLPRKNKDESSLSFLASEIKSFKKDLEQLTGKTISDDTIRENIKKYAKIRSKLLAIAEYRKGSAPLLTSSQYQEIMSGYFTMSPDTLLAELDKLLEQLEKAEPSNKQRIRLLISGGVIAEGDTKLTKIIEELGAEIVVEDNCTGVKALKLKIDYEEDDVYEALAKGYLNKAPCSRMTSREEMISETVDLAREYDVDGVLMYYIKFCPCFGIMEKKYTDTFNRENIPLLIMSGDYSKGDEGQIKTRLEAYLELLQQRRDRK